VLPKIGHRQLVDDHKNSQKQPNDRTAQLGLYILLSGSITNGSASIARWPATCSSFSVVSVCLLGSGQQ
jgi:hypothetical protein